MIYAGIGKRVVAALVDGVVIALPRGLLLLMPFLPLAARIAVSILFDVIGIAYDVVLHALFGQTLGKMSMRIRVVALDGEPISWGRALLRSFPVICLSLVEISAIVMLRLFDMMDAAPLEVELLDFIDSTRTASWVWVVCDGAVLLLNERRRTLSDYLAGTVVVSVAPGAVAPRTNADEEPVEPRFKSVKPIHVEVEDEPDYDAPLQLLVPSGVFICPECERITNFGASECRGCGEPFRYEAGQVFRVPD